MCHEETHAPQPFNSLFYRVVGAGEHRGGHREVERFGGFQVDDIPAEDSARLIALGYMADLAGRLRMTFPGRRRIAAGFENRPLPVSNLTEKNCDFTTS